MAMIVDVTRNTCFTADHLASHKIVVSKDPETCREMHLYGAEMPLGLKFLYPRIVDFDEIDWDFSAGAKVAIEEAKKEIFQPDWKKVFEPEHVKESVHKIENG